MDAAAMKNELLRACLSFIIPRSAIVVSSVPAVSAVAILKSSKGTWGGVMRP
jgi:hypothetical protein